MGVQGSIFDAGLDHAVFGVKDLHHQKLVRDALMRKETAEVDLKDHENLYERAKEAYDKAMQQKKLDKFKPLSESHALTVRLVPFRSLLMCCRSGQLG